MAPEPTESPGGTPGETTRPPAVRKLEWASLDQTTSDADQTTSDADQTASDADQASSESDQGRAAIDQDHSDADQATSRQDQDTADRQQIADDSGNPEVRARYEAARSERNATTRARAATTTQRAQIADDRVDEEAERDETAENRDRQADARDHAARLRDEAARHFEAELVPRDAAARATLEYAAQVRADAAEARDQAAADRKRAANDRKRAAAHRAQAAGERAEAREQLRQAHLDDLTGAYLRPVGLAALQQEIDRARRADGRLVLAFVDVDHLKDVNDRLGHHAGDDLLRRIVAAIRAKMRSYEPIVRFGGDEFVCALPEMDMEAARRRFDSVNAALRESEGEGSLSYGLAELRPDDTLDDLIGRADDELRLARVGRG